MRGGEALQSLISDVMEHAEMEALLQEVENSKQPKAPGQSADNRSQ